MSVVIWDEIVSGQIDGVATGDLEVDVLVLPDGDIECLLVVLETLV